MMNVGDPRLVEILESIHSMIEVDLLAILNVHDDHTLQVEAATGILSHEKLRGWQVNLQERPNMVKALRGDDPYLRVELEDEPEDDEEPDTYEGIVQLPRAHSCVVVPLKVDERLVGAMTLDSGSCGLFGPDQLKAIKGFGRLAAKIIDEQKQVEKLSSRLQRLATENATLRKSMFGEELIGQSSAWQKVLDMIKIVAPVQSTVLLQGETGTGKERVARTIHKLSTRSDGPFVAVNCAVLQPELALSQLFGYERGAFTGADTRKKGYFEIAAGGTLFLDEIAELPVAAQAQLLRVLQEKTFRRLGGAEEIVADIRLIAASHSNLEEAVQAGTFRQDLLFRLNIFPIQLPPLRERKEDIHLLAHYLLRGLESTLGINTPSISVEALECLEHYSWPGNVRELKNVMERAALLAQSKPIQCHHLPKEEHNIPLPVMEHTPQTFSPPDGYQLPTSLPRLHKATAKEILLALKESDGKIGGKDGAAEKLGVPATTLRSTIKRFQLQAD
ncbi:MAG: AAA family ATPase [Deltaproteobacteria bacterium]|nr:AAA family ATPase [Deltaproteobacteria bacterium]